MRAVLKDFQSAAVEKLSRSLRRMTRDYWEGGRLSATCLAAPTGAGKTVMSAAAIETLFFGDDAMALDPDPHAVVLWLSESPALNEQTRNRIMQVSDKLSADFTDYSMLHVIGSNFAEERLRPRNVYFLSKNMLSRNGILTRGTEATEELKKEIQTYVKEHTAPYKYPRIVVFRDELPKTTSGKIKRNML